MALPQVVLPTYELEIPSNGKKIKYRPFVVKEEKLLLLALETNDEKQIEEAVKTTLKGCIQTRVKIENLAIFDLEYIFLQIRAVSVGEIVEIKVTCKDDNTTKVQYNLNLSEVNVIKPEGHSNKIMLSDDMGVIMKYPQWNDFIVGSVMGQSPSAEGIVEIIADCVDQIFDGEDVYDSSTTSKKEFVQFIENLTNAQFEKIQEFFQSCPRLEHKFTVINPNTGEPSEFVLTGLSNFFG
ncbi:baseplate hub [Synechococcus phage ACG-2014j]|uniref:Baseplate hub subunit n=2 Tax=Potamoivirus TaxID=2948872 RepID=A0A1D8KLG7_9CAUD|nr:baseplate hub [Synechococcus phage ACG-2014j]YP_009320441.1 baseplate hub [Synechococcus phage S-CAM4]AIX23902.1 baseplate hub subunit [Synechococcus phage ACG-2014j]AOV59231.1 baseplate hub subunit [Synechococcus phage S-CAM4]AOV59469.1 baseplate hub subunit [Synechococcus phage S-CAM4]